jgi:hypothetical protein
MLTTAVENKQLKLACLGMDGMTGPAIKLNP